GNESATARPGYAMNVGDAYTYCRRIAHKSGANFSVGFRFLPKEKRHAVYAAYAFCRWADDIADEGISAFAPRSGEKVAEGRMRGSEGAVLEQLSEWQAELDRCYA